ncbi:MULTISPECIES: hypothetical protein [Burkholderia]|jgi:hypothetical protein|uniref:hypothetical protein n=1 Tax=Burkholderia TaxID=32008 RepID=UPI000753D915|nr:MULTISPECIES: hypothetical protein [Burkholderia]KVE20529.1 hypothetical protein WI92_26740 [Burkholderia vietnamiensis]KVF04601.1 hypothetical protein WJ05_03700 [Burkholderia vietnamiensis]KVF33526.1 hypothetical protein WJ09_16825 [Burkholderia vietnamiensis]MBH9644395.1 hypothetical protein [Burkholderia vietnamiensis]MBR8004456.1 hypothetical protein [Burkholderia vietnamiensis]
MLTDPAKYGDARGATPDRLRTAAWLQYLIERLQVPAGAEADAAAAAAASSTDSRDARVRAGAALSDEAIAVLHEVAPWLATDGGGCACDAGDALEACVHVPDAQQLAHAERRCPGSRVAFEAAHGFVAAWTFDDPDDGWAALERIASGVALDDGSGERAPHEAEADGEAPPAKNPRERRVAVAAGGMDASAGPDAIIDALVLRVCGPRDAAARIDEMAALATYCAALAAGTRMSLAAYGGRHNLVARAIRERRGDLASVSGLLAAVSVCRLERLVGAGSFWAYYLLAGVVIAAPDTVRAYARRFYGDAWQSWLDQTLAWPAIGRFGAKEEVAFDRLRGAMSLTSRANPIVRAKRVRSRATAITRFNAGGSDAQ